MTFNQWASGRHLDTSERAAFEAVWNALIGGGSTAGQTSRLLGDLMEIVDGRYVEDVDDPL